MLFRARQQTSWTGRDIASCHDFPLKSFHLLSILLCLLAPSFHLPLKFPVIPLNSHGFHEFKRYSQPQLPLCSPLFGSSIPLLRLAGADSVPAVTRLLTDVTQQQSADEDDKCQNGPFCAELNSNERKEENLSWPTEFTPRTHSLIQPLTFISYLRKTHSQAGSTNTTLDSILLEARLRVYPMSPVDDHPPG